MALTRRNALAGVVGAAVLYVLPVPAAEAAEPSCIALLQRFADQLRSIPAPGPDEEGERWMALLWDLVHMTDAERDDLIDYLADIKELRHAAGVPADMTLPDAIAAGLVATLPSPANPGWNWYFPARVTHDDPEAVHFYLL